MKKIPKYTKICAAVSCILLLIYRVLFVLKNKGIYIYFFKRSSDEFMAYIVMVLIVLIISGTTKLLVYKLHKGKTFVKIFLSVLTVIVLGTYIFTYMWTAANFKYFSFKSDNGNHKIIIKEQSLLLWGGGDIYEEIAPGVLKYVGEYGADDGSRPFSNNAYDISWYESGFSIHYYFGAGSYADWDGYKTINIDYVK